MTEAPHPTESLYDVLAEQAPVGSASGETLSTREKETIDRDVEAFDIEGLTQRG